MIPRIIHYCWFGGKEIPENLRAYMESWHRFMPSVSDRESVSDNEVWVYMEWNESNFDIASAPLYVRQAYEARKFAFVSDYVRLWALEQYGGVYFDTDVEVLRSFEELPEFTNTNTHTDTIRSFIGFEESKAQTLGTNVIGCEPHCAWVREMLEYYEQTPFIREDGSMDMTANSELIARLLGKHGLVRNGKEQIVEVRVSASISERVHVYDFHYFSPFTSTRVMRRTRDTYSIHHCYGSWTGGLKDNRIFNSVVVREFVNALIQLKRFIIRR